MAELPVYKRGLEKLNSSRTGTKYRPTDDAILFQGEYDEFPAIDFTINSGMKPVYAADYFITNKHTKPTLTLPPLLPVNQSSAGLKLHLEKGGDLSTIDLRSFLRSAMSMMSETCEDTWSSFGVPIAEKKTVITPLSLFEIKDFGSGQVTAGTGYEDTDVLHLMILISGCYRISLIRNDQYRGRIETLIKNGDRWK